MCVGWRRLSSESAGDGEKRRRLTGLAADGKQTLDKLRRVEVLIGYRVSLATWDHTVLPATRQTHPTITPAGIRYLIYLPRRDGRLS